MDYTESTGIIPSLSTPSSQMTFTNNEDGYAIQDLDFSFPFYGKKYNKVSVEADGFLIFDWQTYHVPYEFFDNTLFPYIKTIAPFMSNLSFFALW